jgi:hypothetical protein
MTDGMALGRSIAPWRGVAAAALSCLGLMLALSQLAHPLLAGAPGAAGTRSGASAETRLSGLSALPLSAQGPVSAAVGRESARYRLRASGGGVEQASNPAQRLTARFARSGVQLYSGRARVGLRLAQIGYGTSLRQVPDVAPTADGNRALYTRAGISEWYLNGPLGIEQGFTLARAPRAPSRGARGPLTLSLALSGDMQASLAADGHGASFTHPGARSLSYGALVASDARGRVLPSSLALRRGRLLLQVQAAGASYPLRIDPLVQEGLKLTGAGELGPGLLGFSVALSANGGTAVVGAPSDNGYTGAVWVFTRVGGAWSQSAKLSGGEMGGSEEECGQKVGSETEECGFGRSVALSGDGDTALVGGPRERGACHVSRGEGECAHQGAARVFTRSGDGTSWSLQSTLTGGPEEGAEGRFGRSVALSSDGGTALVGAPSNGGGPGAAWVYAREGTTWTQQKPALRGGEESGAGHFGGSVSLSGDGSTALVGGPGDSSYAGAAWAFVNTGAGWAQQGSKLTGGADETGEGHFGFSVALSADGSTGLVGARADNGGAGAAWSFTRSGDTWAQPGVKLTGGVEAEAEFGYSVALSADGNTALIGAPRESGGIGAAWLLTRSGGNWSQPGSGLTVDDEAGGEVGKGLFGTSVALRSDGARAIVGGRGDAGKAGAVWAFAAPAELPVVMSVSPGSGPVTGGTQVRISGVRLAGATAVTFGAVQAASFTVNADESITAVSPARQPGTAFVTVTTPEGDSAPGPATRFTYLAPPPSPPAVSGISPTTGSTAGGTPVTITGARFNEVTGVSFGSVSATSFTVNSAKSITAVTPAEPAGEVHVTVTTSAGSNAVSGRDVFSFLAPGGSEPSGAGSNGALGGLGFGQAGGLLGGVGAGGALGFGPLCRASLLSSRITVPNRRSAVVRLLWRGAGGCRGKLILRVKVKAGKRVKAKTIATGSFALAAGRARAIRLKVNALGRSLLRAAHGRVRASLLIANPQGGSRSLRIASVRLIVPLQHMR